MRDTPSSLARRRADLRDGPISKLRHPVIVRIGYTAPGAAAASGCQRLFELASRAATLWSAVVQVFE